MSHTDLDLSLSAATPGRSLPGNGEDVCYGAGLRGAFNATDAGAPHTRGANRQARLTISIYNVS